MRSRKVVDLFSGCGGMSLGFQQAGFEVVAAFENWKPAIRVYQENFSHPVFDHDLSNVAESVEKIEKVSPDIIIGGPPCQDFSTAGRQDETRGRAVLSVRFAEIISEVKPNYFVMENVATAHRSTTFIEALEIFKDHGYGLTTEVLNAAYCGVPQTRKRLFVIGSLGESDGFLSSRLQAGKSSRPMTVHDYLGNTLGIEHYFRVPTNYSRRGVFSIHEPSTTIRGVDRPIPKGYLGHPNDSAHVSTVRGLTPKERSLIQTFPDDFVFEGNKSDINAMIGNAVPVNLAKYVATHLSCHIRETE